MSLVCKADAIIFMFMKTNLLDEKSELVCQQIECSKIEKILHNLLIENRNTIANGIVSNALTETVEDAQDLEWQPAIKSYSLGGGKISSYNIHILTEQYRKFRGNYQPNLLVLRERILSGSILEHEFSPTKYDIDLLKKYYLMKREMLRKLLNILMGVSRVTITLLNDRKTKSVNEFRIEVNSDKGLSELYNPNSINVSIFDEIERILNLFNSTNLDIVNSRNIFPIYGKYLTQIDELISAIRLSRNPEDVTLIKNFERVDMECCLFAAKCALQGNDYVKAYNAVRAYLIAHIPQIEVNNDSLVG